MRPPSSAVGAQPVQSPRLHQRQPSGIRRVTARISAMRHVGGVLGQDARRVGHQNAALPRRRHVDMVDPGADNWRSASAARPACASSAASIVSVIVGTSTSARRIAATSSSRLIGVIVVAQFDVEQLGHPRLDHLAATVA